MAHGPGGSNPGLLSHVCAAVPPVVPWSTSCQTPSVTRTRWLSLGGVLAATAVAALLVACSGGTDRRSTSDTSRTTAVASPSAAGGRPSSTVWVCQPTMVDSPCSGGLDTTVRSPDGSETVERVTAAHDPAVDCFYLYPTVSAQPTPNASLTVDAQIDGVVRTQAARFSSQCRVFAPVYPQLTLSSIAAPPEAQQQAAEIAYHGVVDAWEDYLTHDNDGRGVVLIGHSQGAGLLSRLIREKIDDVPALRRRLVSALLIGGNVLVPDGKEVGGSFDHVPACRRDGQIHCVVAYSAFTDTPPADATFGRTSGSFTQTFGAVDTEGATVLCTNPASLAGGSGPLRSAFPTTTSSGTVASAAAIQLAGLPLTAETPWVGLDGWYDASCVHQGGADYLRVTPANGAPTPPPLPTAGWGLHLSELNLTLDDLVEVVHAQAAADRRSGPGS